METSQVLPTRISVKKEVKTVFIDADAFVALYYPNDPHHKKAKEIRNDVWELDLSTSYFVLGEATTVISQHKSTKEAVSFLEEILASGLMIFAFDYTLCLKGKEIFLEQTSKNFRFSDACNIALIREHGIDAIFSFDNHYKQNRIKRVGIDG